MENLGSVAFSGTQEWDPFMVSFPYYFHTTPIRIPKDMGIVWETYHKGVPFWGVPEIPLIGCLGYIADEIRPCGDDN